MTAPAGTTAPPGSAAPSPAALPPAALPPAAGTERTVRVDSPLGAVLVTGTAHGVCRLHLPPHADPTQTDLLPAWRPTGGGPLERVLDAAGEQLTAYFAGDLVEFDLPLDLGGSPHQQAVWELLRAVPYGSTTTYKALAVRLGRPGASRAVGAANARNPVGIVVPCHRVIGSDGMLTGYAAGLPTKRWLLAHEQSHCGSALF